MAKRRSVAWRDRRPREVDYKEDSTQGMAVLNPATYKRDALVQVWMDSRELATVFLWLRDHGYNIRHVSEIVHEVFELLVDKLVSQGGIKAVETTTVARQVLKYFDYDFNPSHRGEKNLLHNLMLDDRRDSGERYVEPIGGELDEYAQAKAVADQIGHKMPTREQFYDNIERAKKEAEQLEEIKQQGSGEEMKKRLEQLRTAGTLVDDPRKQTNEEENGDDFGQ